MDEKKDGINDIEIYKKTVVNIQYHKNSNTWELAFGDKTVSGTTDLSEYFKKHPEVNLHSSLLDFYTEYLKIKERYELDQEKSARQTRSISEEVVKEKEIIKNYTSPDNEKYKLVRSSELYGDLVDYDYVLVNKKGKEVVKVYKKSDSKIMTKDELINFYVKLSNKTSTFFKEDLIFEEDEELFPYVLARHNNKYYIFPKNTAVKEMSIEGFLSTNWEAGIREREELINYKIDEKKRKFDSSSTWSNYQYTKIPLIGPDGKVVKVEKTILPNGLKIKVPLTIYTDNRSHKKFIPESEKREKQLEKEESSIAKKITKAIQIEKKYQQTKDEALKKAQALANSLKASVSAKSKIKNKGNVINSKKAPYVNLLEKRINNGIQLVVKNYLRQNPGGSGKYLEETADVYVIQNKILVDLALQAELKLKKQGKTKGGKNFNNQLKQEEKKYRSNNKKKLIPTLLYEIQQPSPSVAKRYVYEKRYGCVYAAIKFFLYVINTPMDETYTGTRVIPEHEEVRIKKLRIYDTKGKIRNADDIAKEAVYVSKVPEKTVKYKHIPDKESVRGDWVLSFRGKNIKAFETVPNKESLGVPYDYVLDKSYFTISNKQEGILTVENALSMETNIRRIADKLEEITANYEPPVIKNVSTFSSETFECVLKNDNPRWLWLENGGLIPKGDKPKQGSKYSHGSTSQGFSYQAPRGFIRITDSMLEPLISTKIGSGKRASTLINRFVSDYRSGRTDFTKYFERYLKNTWVEVSQVSKTDNLRIPSEKYIKKAR